MGMFNINGINLNVEIEGEGYPLILLHGLGCDHSQFRSEVRQLSKSYKTIALDCRGHGKSDKPDSYTLSDHVQDVISLLDSLELSTINLYGVSMGSYIAQGAAIKQPQRIKKLILTVPKSNGLTSSARRFIQEHAKELEGLDKQEKLKFYYKHISYNSESLLRNQELLKSSLTHQQTAAANRALEGFDYLNELHTITAETLVISGKYDELNPPAEGKLCASRIPKATFIEMQYSGHFPMIEEPENYYRIISEFLNS